MAIKIITSLVVQESPLSRKEEVPRSIEKLIRIWPNVHECHHHVIKKEPNRRAFRTGCARHQCKMEITVGLQYVILGAHDAFKNLLIFSVIRTFFCHCAPQYILKMLVW